MRLAEFTDETSFSRGVLRLLHEAPARLSRLQRHAQAHPFIILSAARRNLSRAENLTRSKQLIQALRTQGLSAIQIEGHWLEDTGPVREISFFVPLTGRTAIASGDALLAFGLEMGKRFQQEAILYGDARWLYEVDCTSEEYRVVGAANEMTTQKLGDIYSKLRSQSFRFGKLREYRVHGYRVPSGYISAVGMASAGLWPESERL